MDNSQDRIIIFDTTLRDGEQSPGATLNVEEKLEIAHSLSRLGVDIIEAGFAFASPGDFEAVQKIAQQVGTEDGPVICSLARAIKADIKAAAEALQPAAKGRIHTFISTSDIHLEYQLKKSRAEVLDIAQEMVTYAKSFMDDVEFSPMDAVRTDSEYLYQVLEAAIAAGATTVNIPDTVGYTTPTEFGALIKGICENVPNIDKAIVSVHGHNDLGLAVANFLEAVKNGARQLECTINGIGERAGNAALEELVMALHVRRQYFNPFLGRPAESTEPLTNIDTQQIYKTSRLVSNRTGVMVQPNKAIVGANAFAHESGIHQDGVLKNRLTYEIMDAQSIGLTDNQQIVLGKHSGRNAFRTRLGELGFELSETDLNKAFIRFKEVADKKKEISDWDIEAIVSDEIRQPPELFRLELVQISCGDRARPTATVTIRTPDGEELTDAAIGTGPVDATNKAIVGANAFAHESGIHQDGVLKNRLTYEIMDAQSIGLTDNQQIVLGKHSGRNAFRTRLGELGFELSETDLNKAFIRFKEVADKKKEISDWDIEAIVSDEIRQPPELFRLELVQISCGDRARPTATVTVRTPDGEELTDAAIGTGPVDAIYKAINRVTDMPNELIEFSVQSVTAGIDAIGEVTIRIRHQDRVYSGRAANTDIIVASARAYLKALNRLYASLQESEKVASQVAI